MSEAQPNDKTKLRVGEKVYIGAILGLVVLFVGTLAWNIIYGPLPVTPLPVVEKTMVGQLDIGNQTAAIKSRVYEAYLLEDAFCRGQPEMKDSNFAYSDAVTTHNGTMIHSEIICYTQDNHAYKYPVDFDQQSHTINLQPPMTSQAQGPVKPA